MSAKLSHPLVLASQSPVRQRLLKQVGLAFTTTTSPFDEEAAKPQLASLSVEEQTLKLAHGKALAIAELFPDHLLLTADQMGEVDGQVLGKPNSVEATIKQLQQLQNKTHLQCTAATLYFNGECIWEHVEKASLTMRALSTEAIRAYIELDHPIACCGGYQLEHHGKHLFSSIEGSEDVILGLPIVPFLNFLYQNGHLKLL